MAKFIVKGAVKYQGKLYAHGSVIDVKKEDVEEFKKYGWQLVEKEEVEQGEGEGKPQDPSKLTVPQLKALLTEKGIEIPENAKKADLLALLG